jgi:hypothetical protein
VSSNQHSRGELISRIDRLEKLVLSAMSNQSHTAMLSNEASQLGLTPTTISRDPVLHGSENRTQKVEGDHEVDHLSKAFGVLKVDAAHVVYLGGAHWVSIMSEVILQRTRLIIC